MKINKIFYWSFIIAVYLLIPVNKVSAQQWYGAATYQISFPVGDTKNFTDATSFIGFGLDFRYMTSRSSSVGLLLGWNVFHERTSETIELNTENPGTITGTQDRYLNAFPIMANVHYYFGKKGSIRPYIGLNAGGYIMLQRFAIGVVAIQNDEWEWGIAPEAGLIFPVDREFAIMVNGRYNYAFTGESAVGTDINHSYLGLNVGFVWRSN